MHLTKLFSKHPESVGESYVEHLGQASGFGLRMIGGGIACLLHGFLPFWFEQTGSNQIRVLHDRMVANRRRPSPPAASDECDMPAKA